MLKLLNLVQVVRELFTEEDLMRKLERNRITNKIYNENIISKLNYIFSMYDNYKDKTLTINEACLALHSLKVLSPFASLPSLLPSLPFSRWERDGIDFDEFCML
uniref:EF-hand domain-containing protein n=1 Tax=Amphimedon queenslandica TaxID=400682 RepID=A0A1X7SJ46_AMPQE